MDVQARVGIEYRSVYHGEGPVLEAQCVKSCQPLEEEMVYFN